MLPKLAWYVASEDSADIVFASTEQRSREIGASRLFDEEENLEVKREPQWDEYASLGYVPPKTLIESGWWQCCTWCESRVDEDNEQENPDEDSEEEYIYPEPYFYKSKTFCCEDHYLAWEAAREECNARIEDTRELLVKRFTGLTNLSVYGGWQDNPVYASFKVPGIQRTVEWSSEDEDRIRVCQMDIEAWKKYQESLGTESEIPC